MGEDYVLAGELICASYKLTGVVDVEGLVDKLSNHGHVATVGSSGVRFLPDRIEWPATYFNFNGTMDVVAHDACLDDLDDFVLAMSDLLGVEIQRTDVYDA